MMPDNNLPEKPRALAGLTAKVKVSSAVLGWVTFVVVLSSVWTILSVLTG